MPSDPAAGEMTIRPLTPADVPAALRLSTQAGWNQLAADWTRLIDLWPGSCFAGVLNDEIIATATLATYGNDLAWVGMVLVDEQCRGRGLGGVIFDAAMVRAAEIGVRCIGLDASDLGRPLYLKRGFFDGPEVRRHVLSAGNARAADRLTDVLDVERDWTALMELDRRACGFDRSSLLSHLRDEAGVRCRVVRRDGVIAGYGFRRPGRGADQIGPVVADDEGVATSLIAALAAEDASVDVLVDCADDALESWLGAAGFSVNRTLVRMLTSAAVPSGDAVCVIAGLELG